MTNTTLTPAPTAPTVPASNIILIRHGETAWNAQRRLQGYLDIPLNPEGERQAALLAASLAAEPIDLIVSSDLARARQTAQAVASVRGMTVHTDPQLRERCYGGFEGLLYSEIEARFPTEFIAWQARDVDAELPPGKNPAETFRAFYARATGAILAWGAANPGKTIALVAHGGVLECAYRLALGLPLETPRNFKVYNASINRFACAEGELRLQSWGEVGHLRPLVLDELP
jgi:probable phosphoglycerate mutase